MNAPKKDRGQQWHRDRWRNALVTDKRLPLPARTIAFVLKEYAVERQGTTVAVALSQLEKETNGARTTVSRALLLLRELGWLTEVEPSSGQRATVYALSFPDEFSSSGALPHAAPDAAPSGSGALPPAPTSAVALDAVAVALDPRSSSGALPNQGINRSIPPTPRDHVAHLLDLQEDDELLNHVDDWLTASGARVPARFIDAAHTRGDLLHQLQAHAGREAPDRAPLPAFVDEPPSTPPLRDQARIRAMRKAARQTTTATS